MAERPRMVRAELNLIEVAGPAGRAAAGVAAPAAPVRLRGRAPRPDHPGVLLRIVAACLTTSTGLLVMAVATLLAALSGVSVTTGKLDAERVKAVGGAAAGSALLLLGYRMTRLGDNHARPSNILVLTVALGGLFTCAWPCPAEDLGRRSVVRAAGGAAAGTALVFLGRRYIGRRARLTGVLVLSVALLVSATSCFSLGRHPGDSAGLRAAASTASGQALVVFMGLLRPNARAARFRSLRHCLQLLLLAVGLAVCSWPSPTQLMACQQPELGSLVLPALAPVALSVCVCARNVVRRRGLRGISLFFAFTVGVLSIQAMKIVVLRDSLLAVLPLLVQGALWYQDQVLGLLARLTEARTLVKSLVCLAGLGLVVALGTSTAFFVTPTMLRGFAVMIPSTFAQAALTNRAILSGILQNGIARGLLAQLCVGVVGLGSSGIIMVYAHDIVLDRASLLYLLPVLAQVVILHAGRVQAVLASGLARRALGVVVLVVLQLLPPTLLVVRDAALALLPVFLQEALTRGQLIRDRLRPRVVCYGVLTLLVIWEDVPDGFIEETLRAVPPLIAPVILLHFVNAEVLVRLIVATVSRGCYDLTFSAGFLVGMMI